MQQTHSNNHCISRIMLAEGCELTVLSAVESQQAALALSFATGSHDEPVQYLGMAHFLEHLVFRGSDNFATDDGLMAFIQRKGGRVNAQTQAAQTLFHFQVESPLFLEALARLVDMLVAPSLESATLVSEREVIHEEFKMYCQAPQILLDAALAPCLLTDHPLQRFYAGSCETLPIEDAAFASTLATFHQDAYLYSPLKIVLVLPHEWSQWQSHVLGILQPLTHMPRKRVARVLPDLQVATEAALKVNVPCADNELVLHIPINQHGQGVSELADKMQHALALTMDGMFLTYAQQQGWCSAIKVRAAYQAGEQSVLSVCFSHASAQSNALLSAFMQWLKQWRVQLQTAKQRLYEQQAQAHRWLVAEPLHKAQQLLTSGWAVDQGVSTECLAAIDAVLAAVTARAFVHVFASADDLAGSYDQGLPLKIEPVLHAGNHMVTTLDVPRFLFASDLTASASKVNHTVATELVHLRRYQPVSFPQGLATCYWGWSLEQPQAVGQSLGARLADLLDIARLDQSAVTPSLAVCCLGEMFQALASEFEPVAQVAGVKLTFIHSTLCVHTDYHLLVRIIRNLLSNACRYTSSGRILLGVRRRGDQARIEVWDTGVGIALDRQEKIFQEFNQLGRNNASGSKGVGLGLAIVERIATILGTQIELKSTEGRGSCFSVEVPLSTVKAERSITEQPSPAGVHSLEGRCILVIDNEPEILHSMAALLNQWHCDVVVAVDYQGAVAALHQQIPDLIIVDLHLDNNVTGLQVVEQLRHDFKVAVPAVLITAVYTDQEQELRKKLHIPLLTKPVRPGKLRAVLSQQLRGPLN